MTNTRREFFKVTGLGMASIKLLGCMRPPRESTDAPNEVEISIEGDYRFVRGNGVPDHPTGEFPNQHCPGPILEQKKVWRMRAQPVAAAELAPIGFTVFGVAVNGVPFDPAGPHWRGDDANGWQFDPSATEVAPYLGIDFEVAHTQPNGAYHYHGIAPDLVDGLDGQIVGWAADGFPIYWDSAARSSYRLRTGERPGGDDAPSGAYDGTFVQDYEYVAGLGDLDEANGRIGPDGTYRYVLTSMWPYIGRFHRGVADPSFKHPGTPGLAGLPPELRGY